MIPNVNFNPSFANLTALHRLGGMPHPIQTGAPPAWGGSPMPVGPAPAGGPSMWGGQPTPAPIGGPSMWGGQPPMAGPMPGAPPVYSGLPGQATGSPMPQGNVGNLQALMQLFGQRR